MSARILLCRYQYDSLDRLCASASGQEGSVLQRFYQKDRLATEIGGALQRSFFQHPGGLLAQQNHENGVQQIGLSMTDQKRSVLGMVEGSTSNHFAYTPYGHRFSKHESIARLGFNGEHLDPATKLYFLGNGYRAFNSSLMRFHSPDDESPFGAGGLNAMAYCLGDPVNRTDPSGHNSMITSLAKFILARLTTHAKVPNIIVSSVPSGAERGLVPGVRAATPVKSLQHLAVERVVHADYLKASAMHYPLRKLDPHGIKTMAAFTGDLDRPFDLSKGIPEWLPMNKANYEMMSGFPAFQQAYKPVLGSMNEIFEAYPQGFPIRPSITKAASGYAEEIRSGHP